MNKKSFSSEDGALSIKTRNLLNAFSEPVFITDTSGNIIFHNNSSSGFAKDFKNISEIIPELELNGKESSTAEAVVKHYNGVVKNVPVEIHISRWEENYIVKLNDISNLNDYKQKINITQRQLKECQELALIGIWDWDVKNNTIEWSDALYDIYGINNKSFTASFEAFLNLIHPDDRDYIKSHVEKARTEKKSFEFVHRIITPTGEIKYIKGTGKVVADAAGNIIRMAGTGQDITREKLLEIEIKRINENLEKEVEERTAELKDANKKLSEREKELTDFIENASMGMHWVGPDGTILWANKTELEMLGYTKEEYIGHNISEFHADKNKINDILKRLENDETLTNYEAELISKNGSIRYVQISSNVYREDGSFKHSRCFTRDITERKLMKDAIREADKRSRERLQKILDKLPAAAVTVDAEGLITYYNDQAVEAWGRRPKLNDPADRYCGSFKMFREGKQIPHDQCWTAVALIQEVDVNGEEMIVERPDGSRITGLVYSSPLYDEAGKKTGAISVFVDITERKNTESIIKEGREKYQNIIDTAMDGIISIDESQKIIQFNLAAEKMFECTKDEAIGKPIEQFIPLKYREAHSKHIKNFGVTNVTRREMGNMLNIVGLRKNGEEFPIEASISQMNSGENKLFTVILRDITKRVEAEQEIKDANERFIRTINSMSDSFFILDKDFRFVFLNDQAEKISQKTRRELIGKLIWEVLPQISGTEFERNYRKAMSEQTPQHFEVFSKITNRWVEISVYPSSEGITVFRKDITERIEAENKLKDANKQIKNILETITDNFFALDRDFKFKYVNSQILVRSNIQLKDIIGKSLWELYPGLLGTIFETNYIKAFKEQKRISFTGKSIVSNTWFDVNIYPSEDGITVYSKDITESRQAQEKLKESEEKYRTLFKSTLDGIIIMDDNGNIVDVNQSMCSMLKLQAEEIIGNSLTKFTPNGKVDDAKSFFRRLKEKGYYEGEFPLKTADGSLIHLEWKSTSSFQPGFNLCTARDISLRKEAQEKLIKEFNYRKAIEDSIPAGIAVVGIDGTQTYVNPALCKMLGYESNELEGGKPPFIYWPEDELENINKAFGETITGNLPLDGFELIFKKKNGEKIDVQVIPTPLKNYRGEIEGWLASVTDISKRKQAEKELMESEERFRTIAETANEGIWMVNKDADTIYVNGIMAEMLGFADKEFKGNVLDFVFDENKEAIKERINANLNGYNEEFDFRLKKLDGSEIHVLAGTSPVYDSSGKITGALGMFSDITERKKAELALRENEEKYKLKSQELETLLDAIPSIVWIAHDPECKVMTGNKASYEFLKLAEGVNVSASTSAVLNARVIEQRIKGVAVKAEDLPMQKSVRTKKTYPDVEIEMVFDNGQSRIVYGNAVPVFDHKGNVTGSISAFIDVTDRKKMEVDLRLSQEMYKEKSEELETILETIPTPVWISKDPYANFIVGNNAANKIIGVSDGENSSLSTNTGELNKLISQHIDGIEVKPTELPIQKCLSTGQKINSAEIEFRYSNGSNVFLLGNAVPVYDNNKKIKGCVSAFTDITEIKNYQKALQENEDRLRFSMRSANSGSWEWDVRTGEEKWSPEFYEIFSLDPDGVQPSFENWVNTIHPEDRDRVIQDINAAIENKGIDLDTEFRALHPQKGLRWINAIGKTSYSSNGEPEKFAGISLDITERKIAESHLDIQYSIANALAEAKTLKDATYKVLQSICNTLGWELGIWWVIDKEKDILKVESIWKSEDIEDHPKGITDPSAVFNPGEGLPGAVWIEGNPKWVQDIMSDTNFPRKKLAARHGLHAALAFPTRSGEEVTGIIECFSHEVLNPKTDLMELFDAAGRQIGNFVERKKAETKYQDLYENAPDMYVSFDSTSALITQCNSTLASATGYSKEEIIGKPIFNIFHKDCRRQLSKVRMEFSEKGEVKNAELQLSRKDGSKIDVILNASAVRDEDGNIIYSRSSMRDITERKKFEQDIKQRDVELTDFIEKAPVGLSRIAEDGTILWSNKMELQVLGYKASDFINHNIKEFLYTDDLWEKILEKLKKENIIKNIDIRIKAKNGNIMNYLLSANMYKENGRLVYIKTFTRDITARKIAESHLNIQYSISTTLAQPRTLRKAAEKALEAICEGLDLQAALWWNIDESTNTMKNLTEWHSKSLKYVDNDFVNPGYTIDKGEGLMGRVWKYEKTFWISSLKKDKKFKRKEQAESMGLQSAFAFPIKTGEKVIAVIECFGDRVILANQELIEMLNSTGRQMGNFIERIKAEDALVEANETLEDKVKERTAQLKSVIDKLEHEIAERQKAEKEIEILAQAMKSTNDSVSISDLKNKILFVNGAFEKAYGYKEDEILGKTANIVHSNQISKEQLRKIYEITLKGGWQGEVVHVKKNGTEFPVWLSTSVIKDNHGQPRALISVSIDITESKKTQMLLQQQADLVKLLQEVTVAANQTFNLDEALRFTIDKICSFTKWEIGHVYKINNKRIESTNIWHIENMRKFNTFRNTTERVEIKTGKGIPGIVYKQKKPVWITDVTKSKQFVRNHPTLDIKVRSAFAFPVFVENEIICVLEFFTTKTIKPKEQILEVMYSIGTQLGRVAERQRAIETIRDSESKFKAVAETANDAIISIDSRNNIIYFNNSAEKIFGYKEEEITGDSFLKLFTPQHKKILKDVYDDLLSKGTSEISGKTIEMQGLKKDGAEFPLDLSISQWQTRDGLYSTAMIRDISERKEAELTLYKNEKLLREAQHIANIGSFEWDITKNKVYWSEELYRIYGLKHNEFDGTFEGFLKNIDPQDREYVQQTIIESYQNSAPFSLEERIIRPNREIRLLQIRGEFIKDELGKTVRLIGACQDITDRKEAEEQLRKSEKGLKDAQRIAHLGSWEWDVRTNDIIYSDEFLRIYGVDPKTADLKKFDPNKFIHPDDKEWAAKLGHTLLTKQKPFSVHYRIVLPDETTKVLKCEGQVEKDSDGSISRMFGSILDVTDQKLAEEVLRETNEKLKQAQNELIHSEKLAALGRFSSGIAHEIRNPLANISALAQILMSKYKVDPKMKKHLRYILINTDIANRIIKDLLNFASPDEAPFKHGSIEKIINNLYNIVKSRCVRNKVHLIKQISPKLPEVLLNEKKLQVAFLNFISNAIDAMPKGGKLRIEANHNKKTNEVIVTFEDTGVGISQEFMDKIFEPFFTTKDDGTGLGLSLAYQVIKSHEGKLEIQSRVGHGTKIEVKIPAKKVN